MILSDIAKATEELASNHSVLIYGRPKTGKTRLVGTAAKIKEFRRIFWFDGENGSETLLNMGLTEEEMSKVTLFRIRDTPETPIFIETMLKCMSAKNTSSICDKHGKVSCTECASLGAKGATVFALADLTHNDLVVIDSGSQLADSAMAAACLGKPTLFKPGWDEYGVQVKWLSDILSVIQQATHTNFCVVTHELVIEDDEGKDKFAPLMGTKAFCLKVGKYFGTVVYVEKKMNKHVAGSSSLYRHNVLTGSRVNARIEDHVEADLRTIFIEGGILREGSMTSSVTPVSNVIPLVSTVDAMVAAIPAQISKLSLKDRLARKK